MPGLPVEIEPETEIVSELVNTEKLAEISPVTEDTIPDLDGDETTKTGILEDLENFAESEDEREEPLNEVDPPDEDEIQDDDPPNKIVKEIMGDQELESDGESESDEEDDDENDSAIPRTDVDQVDGEGNREGDTDTFKTLTDGTDSENEQGRNEVVDNENSNTVDMKRDSSDEFQDAAEKLDGDKADSKDENDKEIEQINEDNKISSDNTDETDRNIHDDHEGTPVDPVVDNTENTDTGKSEEQDQVTDIDHNANIENQPGENDGIGDDCKTKDETDGQESELSDDTVTDLRTSSADTV